MSILLVDSDSDLLEIIGFMLRRDGHEILTARDEPSAFALFQRTSPKLVLTEAELTQGSGWSLCKAIRREGDTPVIFLGSVATDAEIVRGLEIGAEDFVAKPFSPQLLLARVRAVLRRASMNKSEESGANRQALTVGGLRLDPQWRSVTAGENAVSLTPIEFKILYQLVLHAGQVLPHQTLVDRVWGYDSVANGEDASLLKGHIRNLRRKLEDASGQPAPIQTVSGIGYSFAAEPSSTVRPGLQLTNPAAAMVAGRR